MEISAGSHTIGDSRCTSFRQRLYNQTGNDLPDHTFTRCPRSGGDQNLFFLDPITPFKFDSQYYKNLLAYCGLLSSDKVLLIDSPVTAELVKLYAANQDIFFQHFAQSMVKMGNISPLTGANGEIRKNCRRVNHNRSGSQVDEFS
ncbi:peroxidase 72-like [Phragmites australis]|uniref:peroxidase 72-like n=1 Tax=Phragmites australis TaxID=29695 RepID=UPI002D79E641|nr:peroxidase 72-like [Phragmites australis]